ncbi:hypothetical protein HMPREF2992_02395 [Prevotella sp. HMSC069G02]|jgi:hypothetical protein|nr:hypothetical protein HMPREF2992_02395 [Prevotella sp. HMSC069G02]
MQDAVIVNVEVNSNLMFILKPFHLIYCTKLGNLLHDFGNITLKEDKNEVFCHICYSSLQCHIPIFAYRNLIKSKQI